MPIALHGGHVRTLAKACTTIAAGALLVTAPATATASAQATTAPSSVKTSVKAYVQRCTDLGNGTLCIDVNGRVGAQGVIGVGYWKRAGDSVHVRLGWQNTTGGGANFSRNVHGPLVPGTDTGTETWRTYLAAGCVYPLIEVVGQGTLKGKEVCVPA
ncbi:hypothetical protein OHS33_33485 [Streptomyces sp. NBC_00536]|uniref:hypothetical protein n=1 Tax=Streptomyces sp. NBC_00536 TaxID=2975769 RepID=UPI002E8109EF|nr:hypothetical protein [Streptomyces sp. NBC_00536]WUC82846.1 hypothetical protein OHS33_33485 [Streptomyces sp. NBC_00536]